MTTPRERALEVLERKIRDGLRDEDGPDAIARECLTALEGHGWRHNAALAPAEWHQAGSGLPKSEAVRALLDAAKRDCDAATPVVRKDDPPRNAA